MLRKSIFMYLILLQGNKNTDYLSPWNVPSHLCYLLFKLLADGVIPNEYGINPKHKLKIGSKVCYFNLVQNLIHIASLISCISFLEGKGIFPLNFRSYCLFNYQ